LNRNNRCPLAPAARKNIFTQRSQRADSAQTERNIEFNNEIAKSMDAKIFKMQFSNIYPLYIQKAERKGRTVDEVNEIIFWLTGYNEQTLQQHIDNGSNLEIFFTQAPQINPNSEKITGTICGYRVENIENKLMRQIRYLDKLIDELAKGKTMEKILRK
jgi:hypothetical protein